MRQLVITGEDLNQEMMYHHFSGEQEQGSIHINIEHTLNATESCPNRHIVNNDADPENIQVIHG